MAGQFAGVLGPVAFAICAARGALYGGGFESTVFTAWQALVVWTALGLVIGVAAQWIVDDSVRAQGEAEWAALKASLKNKTEKPTP